MFYYISGKLTHLDTAFAVIDAGGIGYKLTISGTTHDDMPPHLSVSEAPTVKLFSYMSVREDGVELFGFSKEEELNAFKLLITVSGVGPKAAISILTQLPPAKLALAICTNDQKAISRANGVGPKTAARVILELKDKMAADAGADTSDDYADIAMPSSSASGNRRDAEDALAVLGYSRAEVASALKGVDTSALEADEIIKLALKKLMR